MVRYWFFSLALEQCPFLPRDSPCDLKEIVRNLLGIKLCKRRPRMREQHLKFALPSETENSFCVSLLPTRCTA